MRDDVPRTARGLPQRHVDVAAGERPQRDDLDLRCRLEHSERAVEERERRVGVRGRAHAVALTHELTRIRSGVGTAGTPIIDVALEDRDLRTSLQTARRGREQDAEAGDHEQQHRGDGGVRNETTAARTRGRACRAGRRGGVRERDDVRGRCTERPRDRRIDVTDRGDGDGDPEAREHVRDLAPGALVERIGHSERRLAATEGHEDHVTLFAEAARELPRDGRIDRVDGPSRGAPRETRSAGNGFLVARRERHKWTPAHAGQDLRESSSGDER